MRKFWFLVLASAFVLGCQKQVQTYVENGGNPVAPRAPGSTTDAATGMMAIKLSPGHVEASSGSVSMSARLTPSNEVFTGSNIGAQMSLSQSHVSP